MGNDKKFTVYSGSVNGKIIHVGMTSQTPELCFSTHKEKDLIDEFNVIEQFNSVKEALDFKSSITSMK